MNKNENAEETVTACLHKIVFKCAQALMGATTAWVFQASHGITEVANNIHYVGKF